jgi:hypothetical protein
VEGQERRERRRGRWGVCTGQEVGLRRFVQFQGWVWEAQEVEHGCHLGATPSGARPLKARHG